MSLSTVAQQTRKRESKTHSDFLYLLPPPKSSIASNVHYPVHCYYYHGNAPPAPYCWYSQCRRLGIDRPAATCLCSRIFIVVCGGPKPTTTRERGNEREMTTQGKRERKERVSYIFRPKSKSIFSPLIYFLPFVTHRNT
jgi:hypothetical protein